MKKELIPLENLSQNDKYVIAEFIYSYMGDILIKSDAEAVIEVMKGHEVEEAHNCPIEAQGVFDLIENNISEDTAKQIMNDYFSGQLS